MGEESDTLNFCFKLKGLIKLPWLRGEAMRTQCLTGTEIQFRKVKNL